MTKDTIHHYTDINTLALILKNRTIRFNRLDKVDDITEGDSFTKLNLEKFLFVSCWTYDEEESLPQWNMYTTDMAGIRITMPRIMFDYKPIEIPDTIKHSKQGSFASPIPFEKIFAEKYFVLPMFLDEKHFGRKVEYVPDFIERKNEAIELKVDSMSIGIKISDSTGIAALKSPDWGFQKEYRFVLFIVPSITIPKDDDYFMVLSKQLPSIVGKSLNCGQGPDLKYFDVNISQAAIDNLKITIGPLCTEGDYLIVEAIKEKYAPSSSVTKSKFTNTIRKPRR